MRIADLATGSARLHHGIKTLRSQWENVQEYWHDPVSQRFEEEYLVHLEEEVLATLDQLSALAQVLTVAGQECS